MGVQLTNKAIAPTALTLSALAATTLLSSVNPNKQTLWVCPLASIGIDCPGCGSLRAVHYLTQLDFAAALSSNLYTVSLMPFAAVMLAYWLLNAWRDKPTRIAPSVKFFWLAMLPIGLIFTVARNFPGSWLAA